MNKSPIRSLQDQRSSLKKTKKDFYYNKLKANQVIHINSEQYCE